MINLDDLNLGNDIECFTKNLIKEIENIQDEKDLIKLFRESVDYNRYNEIVGVMIDGDYIDSALIIGGYGGLKIIPYLKDYDLIEADVDVVLDALEDKEGKLYKCLNFVRDNFMSCDFIRKFYPESDKADYTPEDLFDIAANIEQIGFKLQKLGAYQLEDKQRCVHRIMDVAEVILSIKDKGLIDDKESLDALERLNKMDYSDFCIKNYLGDFELKSEVKGLYKRFFDIIAREYSENDFTDGLERIERYTKQLEIEIEREQEAEFER